MTGWLQYAGKIKVEHIPCPHPNEPINSSAPPTGVLHTIEGSLASGLAVFRQHYAPHFMVGDGRIIQLVPLGYMAAALENHPGGVETNRIARVQIEMAGHSSASPWLPDPKTLTALTTLMRTLERVEGIPLTRPFAEHMPLGVWASYAFSRRHAGRWGRVPGWYGHVEVPENAHWDVGYLKWDTVLQQAKGQLVTHTVVKHKPNGDGWVLWPNKTKKLKKDADRIAAGGKPPVRL